MNGKTGVTEAQTRAGDTTPINNSRANPSPTLSNAKKTTMSGKRLLLSPRERSNSLMGSKRALLASPNAADAAESNNDSADHFHVAGKRYKRKRPRVDDMAFQASVSSYREHPTTQAQSYEKKMALLAEEKAKKAAQRAKEQPKLPEATKKKINQKIRRKRRKRNTRRTIYT